MRQWLQQNILVQQTKHLHYDRPVADSIPTLRFFERALPFAVCLSPSPLTCVTRLNCHPFFTFSKGLEESWGRHSGHPNADSTMTNPPPYSRPFESLHCKNWKREGMRHPNPWHFSRGGLWPTNLHSLESWGCCPTFKEGNPPPKYQPNDPSK